MPMRESGEKNYAMEKVWGEKLCHGESLGRRKLGRRKSGEEKVWGGEKAHSINSAGLGAGCHV